MSLRTPLSRVLNHGSAHEGAGHWIVQRVTALALLPLSIWLLVELLALPDSDYVTVAAFIGAGWNAVFLGLFAVLACWHSWLGVQVVLEDYVHGFVSKTVTLLLSTAVHLLLAASAVYAVLHIALRGTP